MARTIVLQLLIMWKNRGGGVRHQKVEAIHLQLLILIERLPKPTVDPVRSTPAWLLHAQSFCNTANQTRWHTQFEDCCWLDVYSHIYFDGHSRAFTATGHWAKKICWNWWNCWIFFILVLISVGRHFEQVRWTIPLSTTGLGWNHVGLWSTVGRLWHEQSSKTSL